MSRFTTVAGACLILVTAVYASAAPAAAAPAAAQSARATEDLAGKVKARIEAEPDLKNESITVSASGNTVTLQGEASSVIMRAKAGELAMNTEGVRKVNNKLKLAKTE